MRKALGIEEKCILVESSLVSSQEFENAIAKVVKIKKVRKIVDRNSGKTENFIYYFHNMKEVSEALKGCPELREKVKMKAISEEEAENLLTRHHEKKE